MQKDRKDAIALVIQMSKDRAVCSECNKPMADCQCGDKGEEPNILKDMESEEGAEESGTESPVLQKREAELGTEEHGKSGAVCPHCGLPYSECDCGEEESPLKGMFQKYERNTPESVEKINADKEDMASETPPVDKRVPFRMKKKAKGNKYGPGTPCK